MERSPSFPLRLSLFQIVSMYVSPYLYNCNKFLQWIICGIEIALIRTRSWEPYGALACHRSCQHIPFFPADILTVIAGKAQVLLITLTMAPLYSSVRVSYGSVTVSQRAQYQDPENEEAKRTVSQQSLILLLTIKNYYTCAFPAVTLSKRLLWKKPH